jgi:hypothetical protein
MMLCQHAGMQDYHEAYKYIVIHSFTRKVIRRNNGAEVNVETLNSSYPI